MPYCPHCGREVPWQATVCPYCQGTIVPAAPPSQPAPPVYPSPAAPVQPARTSSLATVSLVAGILGLTICGGLGSIVALITGVMAQNEIKRDPSLGGAGQAKAGVIMGIIGIVLTVIAVIIWVVAALAGVGVSRSGY